MRVEWSDHALNDLDAIHLHITRDNPRAANRVVDFIRQSVGRLADWPKMGRAHANEELRELVITRFPYVVVYEIEADEVRILASFHQAQHRP